MHLIALYVPKPEQLFESVFVLTFVAAVFVVLGVWIRIPVLASALAVLLGATTALAIDSPNFIGVDLGGYGDMAREWSETDHGDTFFALTSYMHVGRGKFVTAAGMGIGLFLTAVAQRWLAGRSKRSLESVIQDTNPANGLDGPLV